MKKTVTLIAGLGQTGHSIAGYLHRRKLPFMVFDTRKQVERLTEFSANFPGVEVYLGDFPSTLYQQISRIIASPGLPLNDPFLEQARRHHIPIVGDIECFAQEVKAPVIAITGTNGKSTVTTLVGEMAKAAGEHVAVCGNIGLPVLDVLDDPTPYKLWVLELSSFQLDLTFSLSPLAATILNVTPDHLDRHHTLENYILSKQRVYQQAQHCVYNRQDLTTLPLEQFHGKHHSFGLDAPPQGQWGLRHHHNIPHLTYDNQPFLSVEDLSLHGHHNWQNALASCALATLAGISLDTICHVLKTFTGLPHRCQTVRTHQGVIWINDSKGTNVGAAISAINGIGPTISGKIILIAGGLGKGADFAPLQPAAQQFLKTAILIGQDAPLLHAALSPTIPCTPATTLEEAIQVAAQQAQAGDVVLLSPACASMDMFKDYMHRGDCFAQLVNALP